KLILTDSGGMQKEAFWLKTPCITLRENTEWTETVQQGANYLTETDVQKIIQKATDILEKEEKITEQLKNLSNPFGDGKASQKIIEAIKSFQSKSS
ncbi:MAG: UDP-N-acetylglucosamine 2-epimerase, partial [Candidatus Bathyarchaeia archaeon]